MSEQNHFWSGSLCRVSDNTKKEVFPDGTIGVSDVITLTSDLGNHIPDKSWMLYLFEFFIDKKRNVPLELDLICQFDNQNYFEAIFGGHNQYRFTEVLPEVGHPYKREILLNPDKLSITYELKDLNTGRNESFELRQDNVKHPTIKIGEIGFQGSNHFTGIEWWNKMGTSPYPRRYQFEISFLQYQSQEASDGGKTEYRPYKSLSSDNDGQGKEYPISFQNPRVMDGCLCYNVDPGNSKHGLTYSI